MRKSITIITILVSSFSLSYSQISDEALKAMNESVGYELYGNYSKAIESMSKIYNAKSYVANLRLGYLHHMNEAYAKSLSYYKKAINIEPESIEARLGYVNPTSALGNWDDVIKTYEEILKIDAANSTVNYRLASIYYYRKDYKKAEGYLMDVLKHYPFDCPSNALMGYIEKEMGDVPKAIEYFGLALLYSPNDPELKQQLNTLRK